MKQPVGLVSSVLMALGALISACAGPDGASVVPAAAPAAAQPSVHLQWLGGPTAILERGGLRVITDPMLGPRGPRAFVLPKHPSSGAPDAAIARYTVLPPFTHDGLDAIVISHTHADHVDARAKEILPKHLPVVVPPAGANALRAAGFTDVRAIDWGESTTLEGRRGKLVVHAVAAHHAHDAGLDHDLGRGNGYVFEWYDAADASGAYRIYWTGDAVFSDEMKEIRPRFGGIDLLVPHLGGVGGDGALGLRTMDAEETLSLVRVSDPRLIVPIHHTSFSHYREPIVALEQRAQEAGVSARLRLLTEGQTAALGRGP